MKAMILAAGFGKRLRPITDTTPKPLVPVCGRTMLDRALDEAVRSGISEAVINVHYLGEQIIAHAQNRSDLPTQISDERAEILETGGGIVKALPLLGDAPFALLNADTFWIDRDATHSTLKKLIGAFDPARMDMLLLLARIGDTTGHSGGIDFCLTGNGPAPIERAAGRSDGFIYAGAAILNPAVFAGAKAEPHSLNRYFDTSIATKRLHGLVMENAHWYTVGTPQGLIDAEAHIAARQ